MLTRPRRPDPAPPVPAPGPTAFSQFDFSGGVVIAVSGGSDSTALLLLLKSHLERHHPAAPLLAVTVDHALRAGSAAEAEAVARFCAARGVLHRIMTWSGPKPATGLPAAGRQARYRLLAEAARQAGIALIATGHTADDQAETVRMRQARSAEVDAPGLAGMASATLFDGSVWIVRPLLGVRREALRAFLRAGDIGWTDDPTNADTRFERPRLRKEAAGDDMCLEQALATAERAARQREDLGRRAADFVRAFASEPSPGLIRLAPEFARANDRAALVHALRTLLAVVGGMAFLPAKDGVEALLAGLPAVRTHATPTNATPARGTPTRATLSRCVIDARRAGLYLHREHRGLPPPCKVTNGMIWDARRRITFGDDGRGMMIATRGRSASEAGATDSAPQSLVSAANAAEPAFLSETGRSRALETSQGARCQPVMAPWASFLPCFDLALARTVATLIGASPVPEPPLSRRIAVEPSCNA